MPIQIIDSKQLRQIASFEINALLYAKVIPAAQFQSTTLATTATPIYDINGEILFYRITQITVKGRTVSLYFPVRGNRNFIPCSFTPTHANNATTSPERTSVIQNCDVAQPLPPTHLWHKIRSSTHVFHAAGNHDFGSTTTDAFKTHSYSVHR